MVYKHAIVKHVIINIDSVIIICIDTMGICEAICSSFIGDVFEWILRLIGFATAVGKEWWKQRDLTFVNSVF